ncbi:MAG: DUF190 domain-containing protein [Bacteroidota bacterium]|nr:DUF190 domain-containing protein [Bacteroidota bacterium]
MSLLPKQGTLLRIFIPETEQYKGKNLYEAIVYKAQELGLAGATVFKGIMGYQAGHQIQTSKILRLSENMPIVIEIIDTENNINKILPFLDEAVTDGLITTEKATIYKAVNSKN